MSSDQFRDEPRTYAEIVREAAIRNSHFFWASIALVTGFILFILIAFLIHAHLTEISFVGAAEEQAGQKLTDNPMEYYYLSFVIYTAMFLAAFYEYLKTRTDGAETYWPGFIMTLALILAITLIYMEF